MQIKRSNVLPQHVTINYNVNGTPVLIKGENLSAHLDKIPEFQIAKKQGLYREIAFQFLDSCKDLLKLESPRKELAIVQIKTDDLQTKHINLQQQLNSIHIWGKTINIHLNRNNEIYLFQGNFEPTLKNMITIPSLTAHMAGEKAIAKASEVQENWTVQDSILYIVVTASQIPHLAYGVTLVHGIMERDLYFVDAMDGKILRKLSQTTK